MATKTLLTVEDFVRLPESVGTQDVRYELVDGELVTMSPGMLPHNLIRDTVLLILKTFVVSRNLGVVVSEQAFQLSPRTVRVPDIAFVAAGRQLARDRPIEGAPDLAIEVISPSNSPREIDRRVSDYFTAGCRRVWLLYPEHREVYIHGLAGVTCRTSEQQLDDPDLLPGFSARVDALFDDTGA
jgi:Uma2 family endonuclease